MAFECVGVDIFISMKGPLPCVPEQVGPLKLEVISQTGMECWPGPLPENSLVNWYRCRYRGEKKIDDETVAQLLKEVSKKGEWDSVQKLFREDGKDLFTKGYSS